MWLSEEEREKVLTDTLAGFLAASPDDIQHAARLLANRPAPSSKNMKEVLEQMIGTRPGIFQKKNKVGWGKLLNLPAPPAGMRGYRRIFRRVDRREPRQPSRAGKCGRAPAIDCDAGAACRWQDGPEGR